LRTRPDIASFASSGVPHTLSVAEFLAHGAAFGPACVAAGPTLHPSHRQTAIPAQASGPENREGATGDHGPSAEFSVLGYGLFALQQPASLDGLRTLEQALAAPRPPRDAECRGDGARVDPFTMLGEIGFLDI
jgi:hypothetical protein